MDVIGQDGARLTNILDRCGEHYTSPPNFQGSRRQVTCIISVTKRRGEGKGVSKNHPLARVPRHSREQSACQQSNLLV